MQGKAKVKQTIHKRGGKKAVRKQRVDVTLPAPDPSPTAYTQGFNSSDTHQLIGMLALREKRALSAPHRVSEQLAKLGKMKTERKLRASASVPDCFGGIVPSNHPFTCEAVFASLLRNEFSLLYNFKGKHIAAEAAAAHAKADVSAAS